MQLQHTMYAPRVGVQVTVNTATVARTCLNPGLGGAGRARRSQEEQGGARRSEGEPGGARKSQKRPGGARTRRGEEEPVAALLTHTCFQLMQGTVLYASSRLAGKCGHWRLAFLDT